MRFYHAAPKETMMKIYVEGVLKKSWGWRCLYVQRPD